MVGDLIPYEFNVNDKHGVTPKKMRFCIEVANQIVQTGHYNATEAARAAQFTGKYIPQQAANLLKEPLVQETITALVNKDQELGRVSTENIIREISCIAFHNITDLYDEHGNAKPIHTLTRAQAACITSVETITDPTSGEIVAHRYKLADKAKFFDMLGKYLAAWEGEGRKRTGKKSIQELAEQARLDHAG